MASGDACVDHRTGDCANFVGQCTAISVAQHHPARARVIGGFQAVERVSGVGLVAVKEMLGIEQRFAPLRGEMLIYDALWGETRKIAISRREGCADCGHI